MQGQSPHNRPNLVGLHNRPMYPQQANLTPSIISCVFLLACYIFAGAAVIAEGQNWAYSDALYYAFVSLTTIGFGGMRPTEPNLWICALYLMFGVTLLSTCAQLLYRETLNTLNNKTLARHQLKKSQLLLTELQESNSKSELS